MKNAILAFKEGMAEAPRIYFLPLTYTIRILRSLLRMKK